MASPILVKRYAGTRLYDTSAGRYVSVEDLRRWRRRGIGFIVLDVETGDEVTAVLLA